MATATVSTTQEQDLEIIQRREELALKVKHASEKEEKERSAANEFGRTLLEALKSGQDVPKTISALADRLKELEGERQKAEAELAKFDNSNEPPSVIQARIKQREADEREEERKQRERAWRDIQLKICDHLEIVAELGEQGKALGIPQGLWRLYDANENPIQRAYRKSNGGTEFSTSLVARWRGAIDEEQL